MRLALRLVALAALLLVTLQLADARLEPTPGSVTINPDGSMTVEGKPFRIKGVAYSIVPVGESERSDPLGDYFTPTYAYMWVRDLPRLKAMGINAIRIYSWSPTADHIPFLDTCHQYGIKVMVTHAIGYARDNPVLTEAQRQGVIDGFVTQVRNIGDHPAVLMYSFGNELNGYWLGFLEHFNQAFDCKWNSRQAEDWNDWGCMGTTPGRPNWEQCLKARDCIYPKYFGWLNDAIKQAKVYSTRPFTATFADIDRIITDNPEFDLIPRYEKYMPDFDLYAFQLYRGPSLSGYFPQFRAATKKPLVVAEYGVDAQNDPCGWGENFETMRPCKYWHPGRDGHPGGADVPADPSTYVGCNDECKCSNWNSKGECIGEWKCTRLACKDPGVISQQKWDHKLTAEILDSYALGGFLFEWHDEFWKNVETQDHCEKPCSYWELDKCTQFGNELGAPWKDGGKNGCTYKAHVSCGNKDSTIQDLCGYFLWGAPDNYVNEAWFGLNGVSDCGDKLADNTHHLTVLHPRPIIPDLTTLFGGPNDAPPTPTCAQLRPCWQCTTSHTDKEITSGACNQQCELNFQKPEEPVDPKPVDPKPDSSSSSTGVGPVDPKPVDPVDPKPVDPVDPKPVDPTPESSSTGVAPESSSTGAAPVDPAPVDPTPNNPQDGSLIGRNSAALSAPSAMLLVALLAVLAAIQM